MNVTIAAAQSQETQFWTSYKSRWYILFVVTFVNIVGGMSWISLAMVAPEAATFYTVSHNHMAIVTYMFFVTVVVLGLFAMWVLDTKSLKFGIRVGAILIFIGCLVKAISVLEYVRPRSSSHSKLPYYLTLAGQLIAGCGQPFIQFTPSKVAEHWFPEHQRVLATTVVGMGTPIGLAIGSIAPPYIVRKMSQNIPMLVSGGLYLYFIIIIM